MTDAPPPSSYALPVEPVPGRIMGIVSLVLSIIGLHVIGIILGFVARAQSKRAGQKNGFAVAGIIVGFVLLVLSIIVIGLAIAGGAAFVGWLNGVCADLGSGVWEVDGITYSCP